MAFALSRWSENAAGMAGMGRMAIYDGSGTATEGGDALATMRGSDFFDHAVVRDSIREIVTVQPVANAADSISGSLNSISTENPERGIGPHDNAGLLVWLKGNDGQAIDILYVHPSGEVRLRGTGIS